MIEYDKMIGSECWSRGNQTAMSSEAGTLHTPIVTYILYFIIYVTEHLAKPSAWVVHSPLLVNLACFEKTLSSLLALSPH